MLEPLKQAVVELFTRNFIVYMVYAFIGHLSLVWSAVLFEQNSVSTQVLFILHIVVLLSLTVTIVLTIARTNWMQKFWHFLSKLLPLLWGVTALLFWQEVPQWFTTYIAAHTLTAVAGIMLFSEALGNAQKGPTAAIKMVLYVLFIPKMRVLAIFFGGLLLNMSALWLFVLLVFISIMGFIIGGRQVKLVSFKENSWRQAFSFFNHRGKASFLALNGVFNMFNLPMRVIIAPLYFYVYQGYSPAKIGGILGLISLAFILGHALKSYLKKKHVNTYAITVGSVFVCWLTPVIWWLYFEQPEVVIAALLVQETMTSLWSYGYFIELKAQSAEKPELLNIQWRVSNQIFKLVTMLFMFMVGSHMTGWLREFLAVFSAVFGLYLTFFVMRYGVFQRRVR